MQLSEAVLAPAWSAGGFAYIVKGETTENPAGPSGPVCAHTRTSAGGITAPFTFSMFDAQFSPVYLVSPSAVESTGDAASLTAHVAGRLDLQQGCYTTLTTPTSLGTCAGVLRSSPAQCVLGELDALHENWTAHSLAATANATRDDESLTLSAKGLCAAELLTVFVSDYLPQRAWLRTVVPRVVDALAHAEQAARAYSAAPLSLSDAAEAADMQRAVAEQWGSYLWSTYVPHLQRKWTLFYHLAVATLTPSQVAPSLDDTATESVTGEPGPAPKVSCPIVDAWPQLRYSLTSSNRGLRTFARLVAYMEDALDSLEELLSSGGGADTLSEKQTDALVLQLLQRTYCVTTTYFFSVTALFDAPFLDASSSVWVEPATHMQAWAMQTMREASVADAMANATAFQVATTARVTRLTESLPRSEKAFMACLAAFLDATTPLTSAAVTSPSDCAQALLKARAEASGATVRDSLVLLWDMGQMRAVKPTSDTVPGTTRYESTVSLPTRSTDARASAPSEPIYWTMFQQASTSFTSQTSLYTPSVVASVPKEPCAAGSAARRALGTASNRAATKEARHGVLVGSQAAATCAAGTYANPDTAACEACPSACSALLTAATPVYCPGDGLMHGCPALPAGAVLAGSPSTGLDNAKAACRYACINIYQAPLHNGCVSTPGLFYNTTAVISDKRSGGWYDACVGPASLLPSSFPAQSHDARVFAFVGSGTTDEPMSCRFVLMHRVVSSAVSAEALQTVGLLLQPLSVSAASATATSSAGLPPHRDGVAWEAAMQLNATLLWEMHTSLLRSQQRASGTGTGAANTSIAHVLVAVREGGEGVASQSRLSWSLVSSYQRPEGGETATTTSATGAAPPPSVTFTLRLLLNVSILSAPQSTDAFAASGDRTRTPCTTPAPSSLTVLSAPWQWRVTSMTLNQLAKTTYRVVLSRSTSTVVFYKDAAAVGNPVTVDWPLWRQSQMMSPPLGKTTMYLSVAGWVAGYVEREQWVLKSPPLPASGISKLAALPLHYDYVPGMVTRLSSTASPVSPLHEALSRAETAWRSQAETFVEQQGRDVEALTDVHSLGLYVASFPAVTAKVSAALSALSVRQSTGLDGVCRSGYGYGVAAGGTSATPVCATCTSGSYSVLSATPERNTCACVPQRALGGVTSLAGQPVRACLRRPAGPAAPSSYLRSPGRLFVDSNVVIGYGIPLGGYGRGTGAAGTGLPATTSLEGSVTCMYGLTVPRLLSTAPTGSLNLSATLQYTTGLGAEECGVMAAARGGATAVTTQPTYSALSSYGLRLRASRLPTHTITLTNNSRLFANQTVLTAGVRDYALLPHYAMDSLLHMRGISEYHAAFLTYMLRCATVSAVLRCGSPLRDAGNFTWAGSSSLDSPVLRVNLTGMITEECQVSFTVRSATAAASEASAPYTSWPYTYLTTEANASLFFEASPTLHYTLLPSVEAFETTKLRYEPLAESSSLIISFVMLAFSLPLISIILISVHPPSFQPLSWRPYERARARRHCQHRQLHSVACSERGAS
ncbi:hypothetical protein, unknown function [Leishmania infantum JPCM5]|uniref:Uncharacterized protein n=2 Tax=Leishmania infantum TaxID=5671 RepID=A4I523_LEIIN|nr:hypothetical protein, unknown function [Leishmania infantum JPCM5]CAC9511735.1 hypothetical_protein_-_conserved [Leishmania infantum]CAM69891.1 hypothetical protein, unknown function [Leishmania infantum JPCM5]SUZ43842.1 hypothetical_protein_-_conserved [Leishmania infantum]|eukprot:XP_001466842.1 hypothetical protein, unknown function [Leishmania infantum JPCM5]